MLATRDGAHRPARGAAAGAFAAMIPAFGLHVVIAIAVALLVRGNTAVAAASCLLIGNPLTHAAVLPAAYALGRTVLPPALAHGARWLPAWAAPLLPVAEETLVGGAAIGAAAAALVFALVWSALSGTRRRIGDGECTPLPSRQARRRLGSDTGDPPAG